MSLEQLSSSESTASPVVAFLLLDDVFILAFGSKDCYQLCSHAMVSVNLRAIGGRQPAIALQRLMSSSLTCGGGAIREIRACFCKAIDASILRSLPAMPSLRTLQLDGCQDVDDDGLVAIAQRCTLLRKFSLYWNVRVTDRGLCRLLRGQKKGNLQSLSFSGCKNLTDETVQRIVGHAATLEILDLTRCPHVTDFGAVLICESAERLRVLRLYAMAQLNPPAFSKLHYLIHLEELDLCGCRIEDDTFLRFLEATLPSQLHTLNLTWCPSLTDTSALAIARCCPKLVWLSLFGNTHISAVAVEAIASSTCGTTLRALDIRGLTRAQVYAADSKRLRQLFPGVVEIELHH